MRQIKFRAWYNGRMIYRELFDKNWYTDTHRGRAVKPAHQRDRHIPVMQFTGLYDKDGKEIYEGDIIKTPDGIFEVFFEDGGFLVTNEYGSLGADLFTYANNRVENVSKIINNIHDKL